MVVVVVVVGGGGGGRGRGGGGNNDPMIVRRLKSVRKYTHYSLRQNDQVFDLQPVL